MTDQHIDAAADLTDAELTSWLDSKWAAVRAAPFTVGGDAYDAAFSNYTAVNAEVTRRVDVAHAQAVYIAETHYHTAVDQAADYDSVDDAFDSYWDNALLTANELGVDSNAVSSAFSKLVEAHTAA